MRCAPSVVRNVRVAPQPGYGIESIRSWVRQANIDVDHAPGGLSIVRCK